MQNILALFIPFLIGAVNQKVSSSRVRFWIAIVISIIIGVALNIQTVPSFDFSNPLLFLSSLATFIVYVGLVVGTAQATYLKYWQNHPAFVTLFGQPNSQTPSMPLAGTAQETSSVAPTSEEATQTTNTSATPSPEVPGQPASDSQNTQSQSGEGVN